MTLVRRRSTSEITAFFVWSVTLVLAAGLAVAMLYSYSEFVAGLGAR